MRFANEIRKDVEAETGLKGIHTAGPISAKWNAKSDEEKEIYNQQFRDEMIGYKEEMEAYKQTPEYKAAQVQKKAKKAGKKPKDRVPQSDQCPDTSSSETPSANKSKKSS